MYNDDYPTCSRTYATLRIYPETLDPVELTGRLGIEPSIWQRRGELVNPNAGKPRTFELHGWFLYSKDSVDSKDLRRHVDWLLAILTPKGEILRSLQNEGCRMDVCCLWDSKSGHGGPTLWPQQMAELARLNLKLWFDVYFVGVDPVGVDPV
jgi:hypothetical protein